MNISYPSSLPYITVIGHFSYTCTYPWNNLHRDLSSFRHGSIDQIGAHERTGERTFVNGNSNMYQPSHEHDETASSVSEGSLCFSL